MRITSGMQFDSTLDQIRDQNAQLFKARLEVSSGRRLQDGAQAPQDYARVLQLGQAEADNDRFSTTSRQVRSNLQSYDAAMSSLGDVMARARQLAVQGASDTLSDDQRAVLARQVDTLLQEAIDIGNTFQDGRYIFAGSSSGKAPFAAVETNGQITGVTYGGDDREQTAQLDVGVTMSTSLTGVDVFGEPPDDTANFMGALIKLRGDITNADATAVTAAIGTLDANNDRFLGLRGELGVRIQHLDNLAAFRDNLVLSLKKERSDIEDADIAESVSNLSRYEAGFQAALTVASRLQRDTLIDRLR